MLGWGFVYQQAETRIAGSMHGGRLMVPVHGMPRHPYPTGHKVMCLNAPGVDLELRGRGIGY